MSPIWQEGKQPFCLASRPTGMVLHSDISDFSFEATVWSIPNYTINFLQCYYQGGSALTSTGSIYVLNLSFLQNGD